VNGLSQVTGVSIRIVIGNATSVTDEALLGDALRIADALLGIDENGTVEGVSVRITFGLPFATGNTGISVLAMYIAVGGSSVASDAALFGSGLYVGVGNSDTAEFGELLGSAVYVAINTLFILEELLGTGSPVRIVLDAPSIIELSDASGIAVYVAVGGSRLSLGSSTLGDGIRITIGNGTLIVVVVNVSDALRLACSSGAVDVRITVTPQGIRVAIVVPEVLGNGDTSGDGTRYALSHVFIKEVFYTVANAVYCPVAVIVLLAGVDVGVFGITSTPVVVAKYTITLDQRHSYKAFVVNGSDYTGLVQLENDYLITLLGR